MWSVIDTFTCLQAVILPSPVERYRQYTSIYVFEDMDSAIHHIPHGWEKKITDAFLSEKVETGFFLFSGCANDYIIR